MHRARWKDKIMVGWGPVPDIKIIKERLERWMVPQLRVLATVSEGHIVVQKPVTQTPREIILLMVSIGN